MSADPYTTLAWLPAPPADFPARCRALGGAGPEAGRRIRFLANHALDLNQLLRLAKGIQLARAADDSELKPLTALKLAVLGNSTTDLLLPALVGSAARHGVDLTCIASHYDQVIQESLDPESEINRSKPDAVLLAIDFRGLPLRPSIGDAQAAAATVEKCLAYLETVRSALRRSSGAICIVQTLALPPETLFGNMDRTVPGTLRWLIEELNRRIAESVIGTGEILLDVAAIAATVGTGDWHCARQWNMGKFPFAETFIPFFSDHVGRILGALRGKTRRCLILDLDNTLWGGVIGDDGLEGIKLAQGDPTGEAHLDLQRIALSLRERGIVLAVSSKNDDETARLPFRKHPEMLLKEAHIAVFQANWSDKATNIQAIARELSLGLEAMVFVDDNPMERGLVREILPEVAVPEMPEDPALYARTLAAAGYFEAIAFSTEDAKRADYYQDNARRAALERQAGNLDSYLASLNMRITFSPFDPVGRTRITQLINKSNQYNLTTRRYTEAEVAVLEQDRSCLTLQVRLADTFADNGMISVVICRPAGPHTWEIDTWLMSCRVLGRRVENMVLRELLARAAKWGIRTLAGWYLPTDRNGLVVDHYQKLGFALVEQGPDGSMRWAIEVEGAHVEPAPMLVEHSGFEPMAGASA
jgi:FkbH-like protein